MSYKLDFYNKIEKAYRQAVMRLPKGASPVPLSWIWPQAALESNWGRSGVAKDCNNLFGMKGTHFGQGACKSHTPPNAEGPTPYTHFDSWADCLVGYMRKVTHNGNWFTTCYLRGMITNKYEYWDCLARKGWAGENPDYGKHIAAVAKSGLK